MSAINFQGIDINDIKYLDYIVENNLNDLTQICIETDLSAGFRLKQLESRGYLTIKNQRIDLTFQAVAALTDYRNYLINQEIVEKKNAFRYWLPHIVNFVLSISAIIVSIIALMQR